MKTIKWLKTVFVTFVSLFIVSYVYLSQKIIKGLYSILNAEINKEGNFGGLGNLLVIDGFLEYNLLYSLLAGIVIGTVIYFIFMRKNVQN